MGVRAIFFSSRRRHTRYIGDWSSDVCSSDLDSHTRPSPIGNGAVLMGRSTNEGDPDLRTYAPGGDGLARCFIVYTVSPTGQRTTATHTGAASPRYGRPRTYSSTSSTTTSFRSLSCPRCWRVRTRFARTHTGC